VPGLPTLGYLTVIEEIDGVLEVEQTSFTNPWTRAMYVAELEHHDVSRILLARDAHGRTIGFCSFWRVLDELHINNLAVLPEHRGQGVASALLTRVLDDGASGGAARALLEVRRSNDAALRLYGRFGFAVTAVRRGYYTQPDEDALVLTRSGTSGSS
jgi:[ribosomal protein S18]-alanine N-acetyltransferase